MLDIRLIRTHRQQVEQQLRTKDPRMDLTEIVSLDEKIREHKTEVERLKASRNEASSRIGELKRKGEDPSALLAGMGKTAEEIHALDHVIREEEERLHHLMAQLPNLPMQDIKVSQDPKENEVIKVVGKKPVFDFPCKTHLELNEKLHLFDFKRGAHISGAGWPIYRNWGARLEWALLQYMMDIHVNNGFMQWMPPLVVRAKALYGAGQLPKFEDQQFKVHHHEDVLYLIPTAEVPLNALHADEIIPVDAMPLRYFAYTPCFRTEAGAAGRQEAGLIRNHQFNKVEMFAFTAPEASTEVFEQFLRSIDQILDGLELHYRHTLLVTGDMSFASARTVDVEVWLPGQDEERRYREVSSVSNCTDYQARRSNIRFRRNEGEKLEFVHTLNGSGVATSRLMVSLLETHQQSDGSIRIPEVLRRYLGGASLITADSSGWC